MIASVPKFWILLLPLLALSLPLSPPVRRNTPLNQFLSELLNLVPNINEDINDATGAITVLDNALAAVTGAQTSYNELGSGSCTDYTVIFARGTSEPGNVGVLVGPPLFEALQDIVGASALTIQGVNDYSASVKTYLAGGDSNGSANMASLITSALSACPNTKLIASGYSQGCQVTHNALGQLPAETASKVSKVLLFGDPDNGQSIPNVDASKVHTVCHSGDNICQDGVLILPAHLTYALDVATAATFATS